MATKKKAQTGTTLSGPTIYGKRKSTKPTEKYATSEPIKSRTELDSSGNFKNTGRYKTVLPKKTASLTKMKCGGKAKKKK